MKKLAMIEKIQKLIKRPKIFTFLGQKFLIYLARKNRNLRPILDIFSDFFGQKRWPNPLFSFSFSLLPPENRLMASAHYVHRGPCSPVPLYYYMYCTTSLNFRVLYYLLPLPYQILSDFWPIIFENFRIL